MKILTCRHKKLMNTNHSKEPLPDSNVHHFPSSRGAHERSNIFPICRVLLMRCVCLGVMSTVKCAILNSRRGLIAPHRGLTISYQRSFITDKSSGVKSRTSKTNYLASMTAFWKLQLRWNTTGHTQRHRKICKMDPNDKHRGTLYTFEQCWWHKICRQDEYLCAHMTWRILSHLGVDSKTL